MFPFIRALILVIGCALLAVTASPPVYAAAPAGAAEVGATTRQRDAAVARARADYVVAARRARAQARTDFDTVRSHIFADASPEMTSAHDAALTLESAVNESADRATIEMLRESFRAAADLYRSALARAQQNHQRGIARAADSLSRLISRARHDYARAVRVAYTRYSPGRAVPAWALVPPWLGPTPQVWPPGVNPTVATVSQAPTPVV
jgi:hypothetical protein